MISGDVDLASNARQIVDAVTAATARVLPERDRTSGVVVDNIVDCKRLLRHRCKDLVQNAAS